jgi:hypothetical protein
MLFLESFDGVDLLIFSHLAEDDFAVRACANDLDQIEVINTQTAVSYLYINNKKYEPYIEVFQSQTRLLIHFN